MKPASRARWPGLEHPSFVPASLLPDPDAGRVGRRPRTARDWTVDVLCFVLAVGLGIVVLETADADPAVDLSMPYRVLDYSIGAVCSVALWWRRQIPTALALATGFATAVSMSVAVAALIALFTVVVHKPSRISVPITVLHFVASVVFAFTHQLPESAVSQIVSAVAAYTIILAWGMFVRARRQLVMSLHDRAERAEEEQRLKADQARLAERARIAREMHDVLGHRVSLIALQAGALEVNPDLPPETVRESAVVIRSTARQALEELRGVIGVLRDQQGDEAPAAPQPTLADVAQLVHDSQRAGANVRLEMAVDQVESAPAALGRDAYRVVQEALTNVHKHVRGAATLVALAGGPGRDLRVTVSNRLSSRPGGEPTLPGSGSGLVGLAERVSLSGGTLEHGPSGNGTFVVEAVLRWSA